MVLFNCGSVWGGDKYGKLYGVETTQAGGVSGFESFFIRLGVTTEFCHSSFLAENLSKPTKL